MPCACIKKRSPKRHSPQITCRSSRAAVRRSKSAGSGSVLWPGTEEGGMCAQGALTPHDTHAVYAAAWQGP